MTNNKQYFGIFITLFAIIFLAGCGKTPLNQSKNPADDIKIASNTLIAFFNNLANQKYDKAVELFEPNGLDLWEWLSEFSPKEQRSDKSLVLKNYCLATQTCLKAKVIDAQKQNETDYILTVQFIKNNNDIFILGPCCGATEEEMPSVDKFDYIVKKENNLFKVATPPVYVP